VLPAGCGRSKGSTLVVTLELASVDDEESSVSIAWLAGDPRQQRGYGRKLPSLAASSMAHTRTLAAVLAF